MRPTRILIFILAFAALLQLPLAIAKTTNEDTIKNLMRRYEQVEEQLPRSVVYSKKETAGDETTTRTAWFNGAGDAIKLAIERTASGRRELTEYVAFDFELVGGGMFILTRKETAQPDGTTKVEESRRCFEGDGELIRDLRKSAHFKSGESLDTVKVPNMPVDLSKTKKKGKTSDAELEAGRKIIYEPSTIIDKLQKSATPADPFANVAGDSEKYRVIRGSASPDGRYAIALGFSKKADWDTFADSDFPGTYSTGGFDVDEESDTANSEYGKTLNYVVDLTTRKILGETGCSYYGTRHRYNHNECDLVWSPDSKTFVELTSGKWSYVQCRAGKLIAGPKPVNTVDLGSYAEKAAESFAKKHSRSKERGSIAISVSDATNDGLIDLEVTDQESSGERKGEVNFNVAEKIHLRETPSGLHLETVNVHKAPIE